MRAKKITFLTSAALLIQSPILAEGVFSSSSSVSPFSGFGLGAVGGFNFNVSSLEGTQRLFSDGKDVSDQSIIKNGRSVKGSSGVGGLSVSWGQTWNAGTADFYYGVEVGYLSNFMNKGALEASVASGQTLAGAAVGSSPSSADIQAALETLKNVSQTVASIESKKAADGTEAQKKIAGDTGPILADMNKAVAAYNQALPSGGQQVAGATLQQVDDLRNAATIAGAAALIERATNNNILAGTLLPDGTQNVNLAGVTQNFYQGGPNNQLIAAADRVLAVFNSQTGGQPINLQPGQGAGDYTDSLIDHLHVNLVYANIGAGACRDSGAVLNNPVLQLPANNRLRDHLDAVVNPGGVGGNNVTQAHIDLVSDAAIYGASAALVQIGEILGVQNLLLHGTGGAIGNQGMNNQNLTLGNMWPAGQANAILPQGWAAAQNNLNLADVIINALVQDFIANQAGIQALVTVYGNNNRTRLAQVEDAARAPGAPGGPTPNPFALPVDANGKSLLTRLIEVSSTAGAEGELGEVQKALADKGVTPEKLKQAQEVLEKLRDSLSARVASAQQSGAQAQTPAQKPEPAKEKIEFNLSDMGYGLAKVGVVLNKNALIYVGAGVGNSKLVGTRSISDNGKNSSETFLNQRGTGGLFRIAAEVALTPKTIIGLGWDHARFGSVKGAHLEPASGTKNSTNYRQQKVNSIQSNRVTLSFKYML